jgi:hypothetical protein
MTAWWKKPSRLSRGWSRRTATVLIPFAAALPAWVAPDEPATDETYAASPLI